MSSTPPNPPTSHDDELVVDEPTPIGETIDPTPHQEPMDCEIPEEQLLFGGDEERMTVDELCEEELLGDDMEKLKMVEKKRDQQPTQELDEQPPPPLVHAVEKKNDHRPIPDLNQQPPPPSLQIVRERERRRTMPGILPPQRQEGASLAEDIAQRSERVEAHSMNALAMMNSLLPLMVTVAKQTAELHRTAPYVNEQSSFQPGVGLTRWENGRIVPNKDQFGRNVLLIPPSPKDRNYHRRIQIDERLKDLAQTRQNALAAQLEPGFYLTTDQWIAENDWMAQCSRETAELQNELAEMDRGRSFQNHLLPVPSRELESGSSSSNTQPSRSSNHQSSDGPSSSRGSRPVEEFRYAATGQGIRRESSDRRDNGGDGRPGRNSPPRRPQIPLAEEFGNDRVRRQLERPRKRSSQKSKEERPSNHKSKSTRRNHNEGGAHSANNDGRGSGDRRGETRRSSEPRRQPSSTISKSHSRGKGKSEVRQCRLCREKHHTIDCERFPDNESRLRRMKQLGLCPNCWSHRGNGVCRKGIVRCRSCRGGHIVFVCPS